MTRRLAEQRPCLRFAARGARRSAGPVEALGLALRRLRGAAVALEHADRVAWLAQVPEGRRSGEPGKVGIFVALAEALGADVGAGRIEIVDLGRDIVGDRVLA